MCNTPTSEKQLSMTELMSQACERCWRRKQKCSREVPICHQCQAASVRCVQRGFGSASSPSEIVNETGIEALRRRVQSMRSRLQSGAVVESPAIETTPLSSVASADRVAQDDMAYLSLSAMAERTDRLPSPVGGLSFLTLLHAATGVSGANPTLPLGKNMAISGPLAELRRNHSLSVDLGGADMSAAFELYVNMIQTMFPFIARTELLEQYNTVAHTSEASICPEKHVLVYLGTATGILLGAHYTYKEMYSTELAVAAIGLMPQVLDHASPLSVVHCLTALTIFSLYTSLGGSTWHLLGLTLTRCVSAGMHTSHLSDLHSENEEQSQGNRTLWTLYVLDTIMSATMDRPFGLNRDDILVSAPSSPAARGAECDSEDTILRRMVQYAQMLRSIRSDEDKEAGILCHFINIRHWKESISRSESPTNSGHIALSARAYMELLKQPSWLGDPDRTSIIDEAFADFSNYLNAVEEKLVSSTGAVASIDALLLFSIGVIIASTTQACPDNVPKLAKISNALTLLSLRYSAIISLRDIILELQQCALPSQSRDRLRVLIANSEIVISEQLQLLIFHHGSNHSPLDQQIWR